MCPLARTGRLMTHTSSFLASWVLKRYPLVRGHPNAINGNNITAQGGRVLERAECKRRCSRIVTAVTKTPDRINCGIFLFLSAPPVVLLCHMAPNQWYCAMPKPVVYHNINIINIYHRVHKDEEGKGTKNTGIFFFFFHLPARESGIDG